MWQEAVAPLVEAGRLVAIGVVQEQHPDRARLYRQWRGLDWPIFVDSLNQLGHAVVPIPMALDEAGIVRLRGIRDPRALVEFAAAPAVAPASAPPPALVAKPGDTLFLKGDLDGAIDAYGAATDEAAMLFRLGVALRRRYESDGRRPGDAQAAVAAWGRALALRPEQYIWRRRIQQYGPRLAKPYDFYGWVETARREIRARGDEPLPLRSEPLGAELIARGEGGITVDQLPARTNAPPDEAGLVEIETVVTPARVRPGDRVRVRLVFRPRNAFWNNEAEPLGANVALPRGFRLEEAALVHANPAGRPAETRETRVLECELTVADDREAGEHAIGGSAFFSVCEKRAGVCRYLRRDFRIVIRVDPAAPGIG